MKDINIFLVRHGQSEANKDESIYFLKKDYELVLTDLGQEQAKAAGIYLNGLMSDKDVAAFVSPYARTRETWGIIQSQLKDFKVSYHENPLIREQEYKIFSTPEDVKAKKQEQKEFGDFWYRFKNAESVADVYQRVHVFFNYLLLSKLNGDLKGNVVIVAHEIVIRAFLLILDGQVYENHKVDIKNCEVIHRKI